MIGAEPIAVTGTSALTPLGADAALWECYRRSDPTRGRAQEVAFPPVGLPAALVERMARVERTSALALASGAAALASAGLEGTEMRRERVGVVIGTAFGCFLTNAAYQRRLADGGPAAASPRLFAATVSNAAAGEMAIALRLGGPGVTLTAGGAAGLVALGHGADLLGAAGADALVAGGVDAVGEPLVAWLADAGFDTGRPPTEAAAMLVLEPLAVARRRGAAVRAVILGHASGFEPELSVAEAGDGLAATIAMACARGGVTPDVLELVVCGAPPMLAALERRALGAVLGEYHGARVTAPKDILGETFGAAGPLGLLLALEEASPGAVVLVLDVCPSGHVAALVARVGGGT